MSQQKGYTTTEEKMFFNILKTFSLVFMARICLVNLQICVACIDDKLTKQTVS